MSKMMQHMKSDEQNMRWNRNDKTQSRLARKPIATSTGAYHSTHRTVNGLFEFFDAVLFASHSNRYAEQLFGG